MASVLFNILNVTGVPGVAVVTPHLLTVEEVATLPDKIEIDNDNYVVTAVDATNVTVRNDGGFGEVCNVLCRIFHSVGDSTPGGIAVAPLPFLPERARGGNGGALAIFGDGSDGDHNSLGDLTLTADTFYDNLDTGGFAVDTAGFRLFVRNNLFVRAGTILGRPGANAVAEAAGAALAAASLGGSVAGGAGTVNAGNAGTVIIDSVGGSGGVGGVGGGGAAGAAGVATAIPATTMPPRALPAAVTMFAYETAGAIDDLLGGAGGGGGSGDGIADEGGGGGGGGGIVMVAAKNIIIEALGEITAAGGNGADGTLADCGGGGGGGGGAASVVYANLSNLGDINADGGTPGLGITTGTDGTVGADGTVFQLDVS